MTPKNIIPRVEKIDGKVMGYVQTGKSSLGLGGMTSKLTFTRLATSLGHSGDHLWPGRKGALLPMHMAGKNGTTFVFTII